ncbi:protein translocase subunit SecD [Motilimonas cestriensis]|uniref:Protein translocase subunit SecD n=1 Tax=Motilimonas cestriensis TaxID=2742685 RepID=A0ABS8WB71_9GAMM|nr:protein translocase subunit SecD [Motilimonas cestriensis]MCE2595768.1 protein translocase subunit SecD [Motilimonas cestriensis]
MKKRSSRRALNQYSHWQYVVLIATLLLMLLSALPSWYGESPALQLNYPQSSATSEHLVMLDPLALRHALIQQGIELKQIKQDQATTWVVLNDAKQLPLAKQVLQKMSDEQGIPDTQLTLASVANAPYWLTQLGFNPIALGLDLRGGVQFLLDVDMAPVYQSQTEQLKKELGAWLREHNMRGGQFKELSADGFTLLLANESYRTELRDHLNSQYRQWQIIGSGDELRLVRSETEQVALRNLTVQQNLQIMRSRIEELGITEAAVQRQGEHRIRIELPGVQDPAQAKNVIGATASLAFYQVLADDALSGQAILDEQGRPVRVAQVPVLTGEHIVDARASLGEMGMAEVNISLDSQGGRMMADFSRQNIGKPMATAYSEYSRNQQGEVVQSNKIISVATIQSGLGAKFRITGAGSMQDAQSLALLLRAGSLTAPVTIVEERTIGPTLGAENISNGFSALALGLGMTLVFMALWYRRLGWIANIALLANMVMLFGLLALIPGAVLTLPGIAGLVLTVGMAVDTNVLIFERIRDKLKEGNSVARAIDSGFSSATSTIFDANFTTMITAIVLYSLGNGPIQGFALTLGLGLLTSMFTGIFASRAMINWFWGNDTRRSVRI